MKSLLPKALFAILLIAVPTAHAETMIHEAFSPRQGATALILKSIDSAKQSIRVAAYSFTSKPIATALVHAHQRGVQVQVVLDLKENRTRSLGGFLTDNGVSVRMNGMYAIMHDKFMIIDSDAVELGSFNYTYAAENRNAENVVVVSGDKKLSEDFIGQWNQLWNESE